MLLQSLPDGVGPLLVGTALALGGLTVVLWPLINDSESTGASHPGRGQSFQKTKLFRSGSPSRRRGPRVDAKGQHDSERDESSDSAIAALREIEFDRDTGKLSDEDYSDLKERYTRAALAEMRSRNAADADASMLSAGGLLTVETVPSDSLSPVELAIRRAKANQRSCDICGPRNEPDAIYCSSCGRYLPGNCGQCGASVQLVGSRFCSSCGDQLAAA